MSSNLPCFYTDVSFGTVEEGIMSKAKILTSFGKCGSLS